MVEGAPRKKDPRSLAIVPGRGAKEGKRKNPVDKGSWDLLYHISRESPKEQKEKEKKISLTTAN